MAKSRFQRLHAAFKAITTGDFGDSILLPKQRNRFIRMAQEDSPILRETRRLTMTRHQENIDRTAFLERVLRAGEDSTGAHKVLVQSEYAKPEFFTNKLNAFEVQGTVSILDKALRRNLEQQYYINTLMDGFNEAVGRDLAELFVLADTEIDPADDLLLSKTDGWAKGAVNKLYGVDRADTDGAGPITADAKDFDPANDDAAAGFPINMFQAMLVALPKRYFRNPAQWKFKMGWEVQDAYREQIAKRIGSTADSALVDGRVSNYKGIQIDYEPTFEKAETPQNGGAGRICMLLHPSNNVWGVFHEVTVEPSRKPEERRTAYVVTAEVDCNYEDENAAVVAFIDQARPQ